MIPLPWMDQMAKEIGHHSLAGMCCADLYIGNEPHIFLLFADKEDFHLASQMPDFFHSLLLCLTWKVSFILCLLPTHNISCRVNPPSAPCLGLLSWRFDQLLVNTEAELLLHPWAWAADCAALPRWDQPSELWTSQGWPLSVCTTSAASARHNVWHRKALKKVSLLL